MPDAPSGLRIKRIDLVRVADVHHAVMDERARFQPLRAFNVINPFRR